MLAATSRRRRRRRLQLLLLLLPPLLLRAAGEQCLQQQECASAFAAPCELVATALHSSNNIERHDTVGAAPDGDEASVALSLQGPGCDEPLHLLEVRLRAAETDDDDDVDDVVVVAYAAWHTSVLAELRADQRTTNDDADNGRRRGSSALAAAGLKALVWAPRAGLADSAGSLALALLLCISRGHLLFVDWEFPTDNNNDGGGGGDGRAEAGSSSRGGWRIGLQAPGFDWLATAADGQPGAAVQLVVAAGLGAGAGALRTTWCRRHGTCGAGRQRVRLVLTSGGAHVLLRLHGARGVGGRQRLQPAARALRLLRAHATLAPAAPPTQARADLANRVCPLLLQLLLLLSSSSLYTTVFVRAVTGRAVRWGAEHRLKASPSEAASSASSPSSSPTASLSAESAYVIGLQVRTGEADRGIGINGQPYLRQEDYQRFVTEFAAATRAARRDGHRRVACLIVSDSLAARAWLAKVRAGRMRAWLSTSSVAICEALYRKAANRGGTALISACDAAG
eukprot:scaffold1983_cov376-Prasinococcus_capsulatus_cf.AAC.5